jgi:alpha/beta superfamily hydrolase
VATAVLLHPHPDMGGNQHNNVISALYAALSAAGITPHRFDFVSSDPQAACDQAIAAVEAADSPVYLVGYSFGGAVAASLDHPSIAAWCLIAPALTIMTPVVGPDARGKFVLGAENDAWLGPDVLCESTEDWVSTSYAVLPAADHFFAGRAADDAAALIVRYIEAEQASARQRVGHDKPQ